MPPPGSPDLRRVIEDQRATNKPINATPMKLIETLISTNKGWFVRQIMKYATLGGGMATTFFVTHGVPISNPGAASALLATIGIGLLENRLSAWASPIAAQPSKAA